MSRTAYGLIIAATLSLSACTVATMEVDPSLAARTEPMDVVGNNPRVWSKPIAFGPFRTERVAEGGEWRWALPILQGEAGVEWQRYRLVLTDGEERVETACRRQRLFFERDGWEVDPAFGRLPLLQCALRPEGAEAPSVLTIRRTARGRLAGSLEHEGSVRPIEIRSVHNFEGGRIPSGEPVGYALETRGSVIAAVEVMNRGRVWIDPSLDESERLRAASAAAALLLLDASD